MGNRFYQSHLLSSLSGGNRHNMVTFKACWWKAIIPEHGRKVFTLRGDGKGVISHGYLKYLQAICNAVRMALG